MFEYKSEEEIVFKSKFDKKIKAHKACNGIGFLMENGKKVNCSCRAEGILEWRMRTCKFPSQFENMGFENFHEKSSEAYKKIQDYLEHAEEHKEKGAGLYLYGPSNLGKSLLACSLIRELMRRNYDCKYLRFTQMLKDQERIDLLFSEDWKFLCLEDADKVLNRLTTFREGNVDGELINGASELLSDIVSEARQLCRPVIFTTRMSLVEMNKKFPSLATSFYSTCIPVEFTEKEFTKRQENQQMKG